MMAHHTGISGSARSIAAFLVFCITAVSSLDLEWTSYSDRVDLPMSSQWRENMKAKLSKVDTASLTPKQKMQYKDLWRRLNGADSSSGDVLSAIGYSVCLVVVFVIAGYIWHANKETLAAAAPKIGRGGAAAEGVGSAAMNEEARQARLRRFGS
mmetsp:Transcript_19431/g.42453  ORF Transcript_19431/g.42453 Transcript_19431/m.42453 type:complete len:154 (+) Transcript_19431:39-500(+)